MNFCFELVHIIHDFPILRSFVFSTHKNVYTFEFVFWIWGKDKSNFYYILGGWIYYSWRKTSKNPNWLGEARAAACHCRIGGTVFIYHESLFHRIHLLNRYSWIHTIRLFFLCIKYISWTLSFRHYGGNCYSTG